MEFNIVTLNKPIFVISDLHIGDRSRRDHFHCEKQLKGFKKFLDYVDSNNGQLIVLGDLFEFWRYKQEKIISKRKDILDKLNDLGAIYIPGNHDDDSFELSKTDAHPFFHRVRTPFLKTVGEKRIKFMHGHEFDPFITEKFDSIGKLVNCCSYMIDLNSKSYLLAHGIVSNAFYAIGERFIQAKQKMSKEMTVEECCVNIIDDKTSSSLTPMRIKKMLSRYYNDKVNEVYDVAIVGHTHKAGHHGDWYFNSGSWLNGSNDFLVIYPDGAIGSYKWTASGAVSNTKPVTHREKRFRKKALYPKLISRKLKRQLILS